MKHSRSTHLLSRLSPLWLSAMAFSIVVCMAGCQVDVGGQTLPSPYYLQDDIQYFPSGPEFKLSKEAAALKAYKDEMATDAPCNNCGQCSHCR